MKCPECQSELVKGKTGYLCIHCGYAGKSMHAPKSKEAAKVLAPAPVDLPEPLAPPREPAKLDTLSHAHAAPQPAADDMFEIPDEVTEEPQLPPHTDHSHHDSNSTEAMVEKELSRHAPEIASRAPVVHIAGDAHNPLPAQTSHIKYENNNMGQADNAAPHHPEHQTGSPKPVRTMTLVAVAVVVIMALVAAYVLPARAAAKKFNDKLASASSLHFSGSLKMTGSSFLSVLDSNLTFSGNYTNKGEANQMNYSGTFASRNYDGSLVATGGTLYSQMTGSDMPFIRYNQGIATYHITPNDWYSTRIDNSMYKYYCETRPDTKYPSALAWYQAVRQIKLQPSALVEYDQKINGHATTHLRGAISGKDLNSAWTNINSSLPTGCEWNSLIEDVTDLKTNYDLYTSNNYDEIQIHFTDKQLGLSGTIITDFGQYNAADTVSAPASSKSLADIFSGRAAIQARDFTRRANIDALKVALDKYAAANKATPPSSLAKLAPKYIAAIPKDPNGTDYKYTVTKKTYSLSATLEDAGQQYVVTGP